MKTLVFLFLTICSSFLPLYGQFSIGLRFGMNPNLAPRSSSLFVNRQDPINEARFNIENVTFSRQIGLMARLDREHFWFMAEALYGKSKEQYAFTFTYRDVEDGKRCAYTISKSFLEVPVSAGVKLGKLEIFSGLNVSTDLTRKCDLEMNHYTMDDSSLRLGWHSGIGFNLGKVLLDVRYQQNFSNYGAGQYVSGQELTLRNLPDRLTFSAAVRL